MLISIIYMFTKEYIGEKNGNLCCLYTTVGGIGLLT